MLLVLAAAIGFDQERLWEQLRRQGQQIAALQLQVATLEHRLQQQRHCWNESTSSKCPSSLMPAIRTAGDEHLKLNLGCGGHAKSGWLGVDHPQNPSAAADVWWDLKHTPWPFAEENSTERVEMRHSLEHVAGPSAEHFRRVVQELYRVCVDGARIKLVLPHHRHEHYAWDPERYSRRR